MDVRTIDEMVEGRRKGTGLKAQGVRPRILSF
jgi:hypothetical protein